jgi:asparaginyl-tRNA synthetase
MEKIVRTKISDLLKREDYGAMVNVKGWVRTRRGSKKVAFIALNDGSTIYSVQVVADPSAFDEEVIRLITTGACLSVNGELVKSVGSGQNVEIQAREIEVLGKCDPLEYPLQKKGHTLEYLREKAHLRLRTNTFGAVFRVRSQMAYAIHTFFQQRGICLFQYSYHHRFRLRRGRGDVPSGRRRTSTISRKTRRGLSFTTTTSSVRQPV